MSLSPDQIARRLEGISATDVAAIVGVNPYRSIIDVWREKRGESAPWDGNDETRWGERMESTMRRFYADTRNVRIEVPGTLVCPDAPWMMASPDGIVYPTGSADPDRGLECKQHGWRMGALYGAPGTDEVPLYELCQCVWNIAVSGLDRWDLIVVISGPPVVYTIDRDDDLISDLKERCERFLIDCVRGGAVPEPDGSDAFDAWLKARWPENTDKLIDIGDDNDTFTLIERGKELRELTSDMEKELDKIGQKLKLRIGEEQGLTWKDAKGKPLRVTWKRNKSSVKINFRGIADDARADARMLLSAKARDLSRAQICLESAGTESIGNSAREVMHAHELRGLVDAMQTTLIEIMSRTDAAYSAEIPGNRPLVWPASWKRPKDNKEQGE